MGLLKKVTKGISKAIGGSSIGGALGAVAGTLIAPGVGTALGYDLGSNLGSSIDSSNASAHQLRQAQELYGWQLGQQEASNIRLWNMQNAYNTPANQMLRFKEAGLNPNLIYGQTNTASPISSASADFSLSNTPGARNQALKQQDFNNYVALSNLGMQKTLNDAQAWNIYNTAKNRDRDYDLQVRRLELEEKLLPYQIANLNSQIDDRGLGWLGRMFGSKVVNSTKNHVEEDSERVNLLTDVLGLFGFKWN